jgi:phosphoenolpyruvate-protein kinase (PTS system EI component)
VARPILSGAIAGIPGAPGVAIGPVWIYEASAAAQANPEASTLLSGSGEAPSAAEAIRAAARTAADQLAALAQRVSDHGRDEDAAIFGTQAMLAGDRELIDRAITRGASAADLAAAVESVFENEAVDMENARNELLAARGADFRDVGARIARVLRGGSLELPAVPSIAVAHDLPPSVAEEIPDELLLGIAIQAGSATAHVVILSRGRGIPAVVGVPGLLDSARAAHAIAVDGATGEVALDPDDAIRAEFRARAEALAERRRVAAALRGRPGMTADGRRVALLANIGSPEDAPDRKSVV